MAVDATVPVLVSLVLFALAVAAAAVAERAVARRHRRRAAVARPSRRVTSSLLRCPRVVLIDDLARPGTRWVAPAS